MAELFEVPVELEKSETPLLDLVLTGLVLVLMLIFIFWFGQLYGQTQPTFVSVGYAILMVVSIIAMAVHWLDYPYARFIGLDKTQLPQVFGLLIFGAIIGWLTILPGRAFSGALLPLGSIDALAGSVFIYIVAPFAETIFFPGTLMPTVEEILVGFGFPRYVAAVVADIIQAVILTIIHLIAYPNAAALGSLFWIFVIFGLIARSTRSILPLLSAHFVWALMLGGMVLHG